MSISEALRYGATELKAVYNRNLGLALAISVGFHLILIGLYIFSLNIGKAGAVKKAPISNVKLTNLAPPAEEAAPPPPPPMVPPELQTGGSGGVAARAGTPVAVPDALISPDVKDFAAITEVSVATPEGGDGTGFSNPDGQLSQVKIDGPVEVKDKEKLPEPDEFVPVEEEAACDMAELQRRVKYPEIARRNGIEGTVVVRCLVDKNGRVVKTLIDQSDNKALEDAAVDAVMKTPFKPAIQNKNPVAQWVQIPVRFALN